LFHGFLLGYELVLGYDRAKFLSETALMDYSQFRAQVTDFDAGLLSPRFPRPNELAGCFPPMASMVTKALPTSALERGFLNWSTAIWKRFHEV
jgi:hypothetical protein